LRNATEALESLSDRIDLGELELDEAGVTGHQKICRSCA
jgi:hypothetical protein